MHVCLLCLVAISLWMLVSAHTGDRIPAIVDTVLQYSALFQAEHILRNHCLGAVEQAEHKDLLRHLCVSICVDQHL